MYTQHYWRLGASYAGALDHPGEPEASGVQELTLSLMGHYHGDLVLKRSRAAVRPIIRRSQPVAGQVPGVDGMYVFSGLGSKGVTTAPFVAELLAEHFASGKEIPMDLQPAVLWK